MVARILMIQAKVQQEKTGRPPSNREVAKATRTIVTGIAEGKVPKVDDIGAGNLKIILIEIPLILIIIILRPV